MLVLSNVTVEIGRGLDVSKHHGSSRLLNASVACVGALLLLSASGQAAAADSFLDGLNAANRSDRATAIQLLQPLAEGGHGVAAVVLGGLYQNGIGGPKDAQLAMRWYLKAVENGELEGANRIAGMYAWGDGVPEDQEASQRWYLRAAEGGHSSSQYNLGLRYADSKGLQYDVVTAYMWFTVASNFEEGGPAVPGWSAVEKRADLEKRMTAEQIAEGQRRANEWLNSHQFGAGSDHVR